MTVTASPADRRSLRWSALACAEDGERGYLGAKRFGGRGRSG